MRRTLFSIALLATASVVSPTSATAQLSLSSPVCTNGSAQTTMGALACAGSFTGSNLGNAARLTAVLNQMNSSFTPNGPFTLVGSTSDAGNGPFAAFTSNATGTLTFDAARTGWFVVTLATQDQFSMYLFNGGVTGISSINYTTAGTSLDHGRPDRLVRASLYAGDPAPMNPVPEPSTYALLASGLAGIGAIARRRRTV